MSTPAPPLMSGGKSEEPAPGLHREPQVLANIPPSAGQRRASRILTLALLAIFAITWPFATVKLPEIDAFVPTLAAALFVSDSVTAVLLFGQFTILRQPALLVLANGYVFSAFIVIAHALAFPGAFSRTGLFGSGLQSAVWIYWFWHSGLPLAVIGYVLLKSKSRTVDGHSMRLAIGLSAAATIAFVVGMFWFVTQHHELLPVTFVDVHPLSVFRRVIGGVVTLVLGGTALLLLWARGRTLLDEWLMVALCALLIEVALASILSGDRYTLSWYAGRFYQLVTAAVVMTVLLAETTTLYADVARSNTLLLNERVLLERAVQAQRREREARLLTGDAVAATIAHEVKQPLSGMMTSAEAGLRFLDRTLPEVDEAKDAFSQILAAGHRAGAVIGSIRTIYKKEVRNRNSLDLNELIRETLSLVQDDLSKHRILVETHLSDRLWKVMGDRIQLQQVLVNLITNAIDSMTVVDGSRVLTVQSQNLDDREVGASIADSGNGISSPDADRLFSPLFTTKADGTGMGLLICRSIIESHYGRLWFTPNVPRGAVFHFCIGPHPGDGALS